MSFRGIIASGLAHVPAMLGQTIAYRLRTTAPDVQPGTFGAWVTDQTGQVGGVTIDMVPDAMRRGTSLKEYARLVVSSSMPVVIGSQVRNEAGTVYAVLRELATGPGLSSWLLGRERRPVKRADRGGTVG